MLNYPNTWLVSSQIGTCEGQEDTQWGLPSGPRALGILHSYNTIRVCHYFRKDYPHKSDEHDWRWIRDSRKKEQKLLKRDGHSQNAAEAHILVYWVRAPMGSHQGPSTAGHNNTSAWNVEVSVTLPRKTLSLETNRKEGDCFTTRVS
jgi:hypothetical protein